jgi:hypothetical protein
MAGTKTEFKVMGGINAPSAIATCDRPALDSVGRSFSAVIDEHTGSGSAARTLD